MSINESEQTYVEVFHLMCKGLYLDCRLLDTVAIDTGVGGAGRRAVGVVAGRSGHAVEVAFDFRNAVVCGEQTLAIQSLEHRTNTGPVHHLQHEEVRL